MVRHLFNRQLKLSADILSGLELTVVVLLLLLAAGVRLAGIDWGQPDMADFPSYAPDHMIHPATTLHPDEYFYASIPMQMVVKQHPNPNFFENPSFLINVNFVTYLLTGADAGISAANRDGVGRREYTPFAHYVYTRVFSALGGVLAVAGVYALARRTARSIKGGQLLAALGAALLTALSFTMVQHAHYSTTSSLASAFTVICVWASLAALRGGVNSRRPLTSQRLLFVLAGIAAGFAGGNRYNAAAVSLVVFFTGWVLLYRAYVTKQAIRPTVLTVLVGWFAFPLAYLFSTPFTLLDFPQWWGAFQFITTKYLVGNVVIESTANEGLLFELQYLIRLALGIPAALLVLLGLGAAWQTRPRSKQRRSEQRRSKQRGRDLLRRNSAALDGLLMLSCLIPYILVNMRTIRPNMAEQMQVPIIPLLAVFAGLGTAWLYTRLPLAGRSRAVQWIGAGVLLAVLLITPLIFTTSLLRQLTRPDSRDVARAWVYDHLPVGSAVRMNGSYNVALDEALYLTSVNYIGQYPPLEELRAEGVDYMIMSDALIFDGLISPVWSEQDRADLQAYLDTFDNLPVLWEIARPVWPGYTWFMNSFRIWHNPAITITCLNEEACAAVH